MSAQKETLYIDAADEITTVIEKIQGSDAKVLALVLPKRASAFQSIVNLRLVKRASAQAKKNIVLITSDVNLLPLAGATGIYVAKSLQSKPEVPARPAGYDVDEEDDGLVDPNKSIGEHLEASDDQPIEIDNADEVEEEAPVEKSKYDRSLKVPDFNKFRLKLIIGLVIGVALLVFGVFAVFILPRATITIKTDTTDVSARVNIISSPTIKETDVKSSRVPGVVKELRKSDSVKVPSTAQKDVGTKASGEVSLTLKGCSEPSVTIPAGTAVSTGSSNFITQTSVTLISTVKGGECKNDSDATGTTKVIAQNAGDQYNLSSRGYSVAGFSSVSGAGTAMSGGTSKVIKVVSQADIDGAKQKLIDGFGKSAPQELTEQLKSSDFFVLADTFTAKEPLITSSPAVDSESDNVTVNVSISYTMSGANNEGVIQLLEDSIKNQIDTNKQKILDNGLSNATIQLENKQTNGQVSFVLSTTAKAGVEQDEAGIKELIKGKKKGEVQASLQARPGIKEVEVSMSPFWVYKVPNKESRITLVFEQQGNIKSDDR